MKANFKIAKELEINKVEKSENTGNEKKELTKEEFEQYVINSGAKGSFMIYRSTKENDELGLEQL